MRRTYERGLACYLQLIGRFVCKSLLKLMRRATALNAHSRTLQVARM